MLKDLCGIIISVIILIIFYFLIYKYFKSIGTNIPNVFNFFTKKEGMQNMTKTEDCLQNAINQTQYFIQRPRPFADDSSFFSFLTRFDPFFKPPKYEIFPHKASQYAVKFDCRPTTTGMFTDCGPLAPNSCS